MSKYCDVLQEYVDQGFKFNEYQGQGYSYITVSRQPLENECVNTATTTHCNGLFVVAIYDLINERFINSFQDIYNGNLVRQESVYDSFHIFKIKNFALRIFFNDGGKKFRDVETL